MGLAAGRRSHRKHSAPRRALASARRDKTAVEVRPGLPPSSGVGTRGGTPEAGRRQGKQHLRSGIEPARPFFQPFDSSTISIYRQHPQKQPRGA
ncbi:unnamed protein product [Parajaminaea phylloscopi]